MDVILSAAKDLRRRMRRSFAVFAAQDDVKHLLVAVSLLFSMPLCADTIALVGGTVIDVSDFGRSGHDIRNAVVIIDGEKIAAVGPRRSVTIPSGARRIDVSGKYIVPGLTDAFAALGNQRHANAYLYMGVTSIVGVAGGRRLPLFLTADPSPRIYPLDTVGYEMREGKLLQHTESETLREIEGLTLRGTRVLLVHYPITAERTAQIVRKARELGVATIGELGMTPYQDAIQAGVQAFVHTSRYSLGIASPETRLAVAQNPFGPPRNEFYRFLTTLRPDDEKLNQYAALLASSNVGLIPTLSLEYLDLPNHKNPWKEPVARLIDPKEIHMPANPETGNRDVAPASAADTMPPNLAEALLRIEERYRRAGAKYLTGSGTTAFGTMPGISLHTELELLTRIGLPAREAIAAATANFGEIFGWKGIGQVRPGYNADLLVLNSNPLKDIENLKKIQTVILNGKVLDRDDLLTANR